MMGIAPLKAGGSIAYDLDGSGPTLVLISGLGGLASFFAGYADAARRAGFRTLRYDHRGVGRSSPLEPGDTSIPAMVDDVIGLLDHLGIDSAAVLGHSTGGAIAQMLAADHPERVSRLVLSATFAKPCAYMRRLFEGRLEILDRLGLDAYRRHAALILNTPDWIAAHDDALSESLARPSETTAATVAARIGAILAHDATSRLGDIGAPTLVVVAEDDIVTPAYLSRELAAAIPGAELAILRRGGHYALNAYPEAYCAAVLPFLMSAAKE
jgi:aminoacrylate hydrolase